MKAILATLLLFAALALPAGNGFVTVGRGTPAKLDGRLDDPAWRNAVVLTPFVLQGQNRFAQEQTEVRMLWDDECLYLGVWCHAAVLDPLANRLGDLRRNIQEHDRKNIYKDDCVELLLNPDGGGRVFDLVVSASGACADSAAPLRDMWNGRDFAWESSARIAVFAEPAKIRPGWGVEAALPWKSLGGKPQPGGRPWRFAVGRHEHAVKEVSSFQPAKAGLHHPANLGELRFAAAVPEIALAQRPLFTPGANAAQFRLGPRAEVELRLAAANAAPQYYRTSGQGLATLRFPLRADGRFTFAWAASDAATFTELFRSPDYQMAVNASTLQVKKDAAGLRVNGAAASGTVLLQKGINELALPVGAPLPALVAAGAPLPPGHWLADKDGSRRLRLGVGVTELWPNWQNAGVVIPRGGLQQFIFAPSALPNVSTPGYSLVLELPEGLEVAAATGYYERHPLALESLPAVTRQGAACRRWRIRLLKPLKWQEKIPLYQRLAVLVRAAENGGAERGEIRFYAESAETGFHELPNRIDYRLIPKLKARTPRKWCIQLWTGWITSADSVEYQRLAAEFFATAGINSIGGMQGMAAGVNGFKLLNFADWNFNCTPYLDKHPGTRRITPNGPPDRRPFVCSHEMLYNPEFAAFLRDGLPGWHRRMLKPEMVVWDYESPPFDSRLACFCPRCLQEFAAKFKVQGQITPARIKAELLPEWTTFQTQRVADMSGLFRDAIHATLPGVRYGFYSGYQSESSRRQYSIDWRLINGRVDIAMCGYGRPAQELAATRAAVQRTPLMLGELFYPYRETERSEPGQATAATLLRRACDATAGILLYNYPTLDGRTFAAVAEVSRAVAAAEECFLNGEHHPEWVQVQGAAPEEFDVLCDGKGAAVLALMNPHTAPRAFRCNALGGRSLAPVDGGAPAATQSVTLPAGGIALFLIR